MKKKTKKLIIILFSISALLILLISGVFLYYNNKLAKVNHKAIPKSNKALGINEEQVKKNNFDDYINILFLGIDTRDYDEDSGRSDVIMIMTIDQKHKKIKLTSLMRDSIESMTGKGPMKGKNQDKLNHAYAYGGPALSIKTINENYNLNIKDYVKVDFFGLEKIIDSVGGVDINIKKDEIPVMNSYINEIAKIEKKSPVLIENPGIQHLNGSQALGYCRIRYVGNADFERTERQRTVLIQIVNRLSSLNYGDINDITKKILPNVETSLSNASIYKLALNLIINKPKKIEELRIPIDGTYNSETINNTYFLGWDKEKNLQAIKNFITEDSIEVSNNN